MQKTILIFDFDGTIADTLQLMRNVSNHLSKEFHFKHIEPEDVDTLKNMSSQELIKYLHIPFLMLPLIITKAKQELHKDMETVEPIAGLKEILFKLKELKFKMGILTSNSAENVKKFVNIHQLNCFDFITSTTQIWGKHVSLKKLMNQQGFQPENIIYIGDETRDIPAARKAGVKIAAVTWGFNSKNALQKHHPDFLLTKPEQLLNLYTSE